MDDNDVVIEILIRLPIKSLLRFRCVCKWWSNLISDPIFISTYSRRNPQLHVSGFYLQKYSFMQLYPNLNFIPCDGQVDAAPESSLSFIEDESGVCIQHSCNGLLLCSSSRCVEEDRRYYICVPTTKQYVSLPKTECKTVFGASIAFDPSISPHYQVICVCDSILSVNHRQIKIYNSDRGSWRVSGDPFVMLDDLLFNRGVFWNGALHWVGQGALALGFDVGREILLTMVMPPIQEGWTERKIGYFGESRGSLYLIEIYGSHTSAFDVMEMNVDYSGWSVRYRVNLDAVVGRNLPEVWNGIETVYGYRFAVIHLIHRRVPVSVSIGRNEEELLMVVRVRGRGFVLYNVSKNELVDDVWQQQQLEQEQEQEQGVCPQLQLMRMDVIEKHGLCYTWEKVYPYSNNILCYL